MRRRVARVVRIGLFVLGVALLAWLPFSFFVWIGLSSPFPLDGANVEIGDGHLSIAVVEFSDVWDNFALELRSADEWPASFRRQRRDRAFVPKIVEWRLSAVGFTTITIPLWLLAAICLAWPVTSLLLGRRRHKRGFPVEPKPPDAAVPPPTS